jgi:hypothetical protein
MIPSSACPSWLPDRAANAAQEHRSYTTPWGTILSEMPDWERKRFLAWAAERARERCDLGLLRVVRAYQKAHGISYRSPALNLR